MSLKRMVCFSRIGSSADVMKDLSIRSSSRGAEIPEDLLIEILLRVPANLVTKFRRLSKFHRDWIDSPDFIRKHYNLSIKRKNCGRIIRCWIWRDGKTDYLAVSLDSAEFGDAIVEKSINSLKENGYCIVDSCVGILCLLLSPKAGRDGHILVWNPLTGGRRIIDIVPDDYKINFSSSYSLGHDAATDDLKILKIGHKCPFLNDPSEYHCEIYSYRIGSWRKISDNNCRPPTSWSHRIFVEGTNSLHTVDPRDGSVITFDFSLEKFSRIPLPRECSMYPYQCSLLDLDGWLCIGGFGMPCEACTSPCWSVWGMTEYGVKESWTWLFSVHNLVRSLLPVWPQFVNGGRQLLLLSTESEEYEVLRLYDFEDKRLIMYEKVMIDVWSLDRPPEQFLYIPSLRQVRQSCPE